MGSPNRYWALTVAFTTTISFIVMLPLIQIFSLLFRDTWTELNFTGTQTAFVLCTAVCMSSSTATCITALIRKFGCRTVGFTGGLLISSGFLLTAYATRFEHFIGSFGVIAGLGIGMVFQAFPTALHSYFVETRTRANGYILAISGVGPFFMPQIVAFLMAGWDVKTVMLLLAAVVAHVAILALLLRPVQSHEKQTVANEQVEKDEAVEFLEKKKPKTTGEDLKATEKCQEAISSGNGTLQAPANDCEVSAKDPEENQVFTESAPNQTDRGDNEPKRISPTSRALNSIVDALDLTPLRDPSFANLAVGLSLDFASETTYTVLLPFIASDKMLDIEETATFMSVTSAAEVVLGLLAPFVAQLLQLRERPTFAMALVGLICARSGMVYAINFPPLVVCAAAIGAVRGLRAVYWVSIIPNYAPAVSRLQFTMKGIALLIGGYLIGLVKDLTGSYVDCIHLMNLLTSIPILTWTIEFIYKVCKFKQSS